MLVLVLVQYAVCRERLDSSEEMHDTISIDGACDISVIWSQKHQHEARRTSVVLVSGRTNKVASKAAPPLP